MFKPGKYLQTLNMFLQRNGTFLENQQVCHRLRVVSSLNMAKLHYFPTYIFITFSVSTYFSLLSFLTTWDVKLHNDGDRFVIRGLEVTKAYLQSNTSQRIIIHKPKPELFDFFEINVSSVAAYSRIIR